MSARNTVAMLVTCALLALSAGIFVYAFGRTATAAYLPDALHVPLLTGVWPLHAADWLPTFVHVFGFSLITPVVAGVGRSAAIAVPACWALVNILFELGQHPAIAPRLGDALTHALGAVAHRSRLSQYFINGTFDPADLLAAIAAAALATGLCLQLTRKAQHEHS